MMMPLIAEYTKVLQPANASAMSSDVAAVTLLKLSSMYL